MVSVLLLMVLLGLLSVGLLSLSAVSLRTSGLEVISPPIAVAEPVTTLNTPFGMPARSARWR